MIGRGRGENEIYFGYIKSTKQSFTIVSLAHRSPTVYFFMPSQIVQYLHIVMKMIFVRYFYLALGMTNS